MNSKVFFVFCKIVYRRVKTNCCSMGGQWHGNVTLGFLVTSFHWIPVLHIKCNLRNKNLLCGGVLNYQVSTDVNTSKDVFYERDI